MRRQVDVGRLAQNYLCVLFCLQETGNQKRFIGTGNRYSFLIIKEVQEWTRDIVSVLTPPRTQARCSSQLDEPLHGLAVIDTVETEQRSEIVRRYSHSATLDADDL